MPAEIPLQVDMFTGALVDRRTAAQRQRDAAADKPRQMEMFSQRELAQHVPTPMMPLSLDTKLVLVMEDPRTEGEKEADREREARERTIPLFVQAEPPAPAPSADAHEEGDPEVEVDDAATPTELTPEALQAAARAELERVVTDITYIPTAEGWLYLAGIQDAFSRRIVGWSMRERPTKALVCDAWKLAVGQRGVPRLHHSDQGSQYTSDDYLRLLEKDEVVLSMGDVGRCYDNAMQESFWGTLKTECADRPFPSRAAARQAIFEYIELWYNRQRRHSALGYLSPAEFEQLHRP
jgi:transposase InsO family protein